MRPGMTRDFEFCSNAPFGPAVLPAGNGRHPMAFWDSGLTRARRGASQNSDSVPEDLRDATRVTRAVMQKRGVSCRAGFVERLMAGAVPRSLAWTSVRRAARLRRPVLPRAWPRIPR